MTARGPGASNRTAGLRWQRACAAWLRDYGWPLAMSASRGADMIAGPVAVECTIAGWDKTWIKIGQADFQALTADVPYGAVWRKRNREPGARGAVDPGAGAVTMQADRFWSLVKELGTARERAAAAERDLERWMARERAG